jgi:hypothetical protein
MNWHDYLAMMLIGLAAAYVAARAYRAMFGAATNGCGGGCGSCSGSAKRHGALLAIGNAGESELSER